EGAWPGARAAPVVGADLVFGLALLLLDQRLLRHLLSPFPGGLGGLLRTTNRTRAALLARHVGLAPGKREPKRVQQGLPAGVVGGGGDDGDVHATRGIDTVVIDLGEDQLLVDPERVVAAPVPRRGRQATEVADPGNGDRDQAIEEFPHPVAPQRDFGADRLALPELETGDRLGGPGDKRLLTRDGG